MAKKVSGNVTFITGIESISRKLALRKKTCTDKVVGNYGPSIATGHPVQIEGTTYLGVVSRKRMVLGKTGFINQSYLFLRKPMIAKAATEDQLAVRTKFVAINAWVNAADKDLQAIAYNQEQYLKCVNDLSKGCSGVGVSGFSGYRGWMKGVASAMYGDYSDPQTLPENHKVPAAA